MKRKDYKEIIVPEGELLGVLSKSFLCAGISFSELKTISPFFLTLKVPAGSKIYEEGDLEAFLCLIAAGTVSIVKGLGLPSKQVVATLGPGESVGELSVLDEQPRSASVIASTDAVLFSLTRRNLIEMHNTAQYVWSKIIFNIALLLATRLRNTTDLLAETLASNAVSQTSHFPNSFFQ